MTMRAIGANAVVHFILWRVCRREGFDVIGKGRSILQKYACIEWGIVENLYKLDHFCLQGADERVA